MLPALTDFVALVGIAVVACAAGLRLPGLMFRTADWAIVKGRWMIGICFVVMWIPVGVAHIPVAAYIRGVTSDFSVSLVVLAALNILSRLFSLKLFDRRECQTVFYVGAAAALFLYPLALGWGDWDAYRPGWGSAGMWAALLAVCLLCWVAGLRLLPLLIGIAMLSWTVRLMESTNLWDYLVDPWLAAVAIFESLAAGATQLRHRLLRKSAGGAVGSEV
jgi:hypothetical protein